VCQRVDDGAQPLPELVIGVLPECLGLSTLDIADDFVREPYDPASAFGRHDQFRPPVALFGTTLNVPERFEFVDDSADYLFVTTGSSCEFRGPEAVVIEVGDDGAVGSGEVSVPGLLQMGVELVLDGEQQSGGQDAKPRLAPLRPCSLGAVHTQDRMLVC